MTREFGATAWGRAWLKQIEPVLITGAPDRDLPRARALARHAITDLTITGRRVTASITDRSHGQTLALDIPAWSGDEQRTVERALTSTGSFTLVTCPTAWRPTSPRPGSASLHGSRRSPRPVTPGASRGGTCSPSATPSCRESTRNPSSRSDSVRHQRLRPAR
ncbi:hypothetical protein GCM10009811_31320 [Nostocoides veronense]|uniref:Uncharacterized protein n=1 Tax=Nostocoides veronense TaxID=330836 RepID=A0ABN2M0L4_9MICO